MSIDPRLARELKLGGVVSPQILEAMDRIDRRLFVPERFGNLAGGIGVVPLANGQYIQHKVATAQILQAADIGGDQVMNVLVVGAGSLYSSVLLKSLGCNVTALERQPDLVWQARKTLDRLMVKGVDLHLANGLDGWIDGAPYDRIILFGATENIRPSLVKQLSPNGIILIPADIDGEPKLLKNTTSAPTQVLPLYEAFTSLEDSDVVYNRHPSV